MNHNREHNDNVPNDGFNLEERTQGQARDLHGRTRRLVLAEELSVDAIDSLEVVHVTKEDLHTRTMR